MGNEDGHVGPTLVETFGSNPIHERGDTDATWIVTNAQVANSGHVANLSSNEIKGGKACPDAPRRQLK